MVKHTSIVVLGLVVAALVGAFVLGSGSTVVAARADLQPSAGGPPEGSHGACVVSAVRAIQNGDPSSGIGWMIRGMARRC